MTFTKPSLLTWIKILLGSGILFFIGRQFYADLTSEHLNDIVIRPWWLVASAGLYLLGLATWGLFWFRLMRLFDQNVTLGPAMRGYFFGQLGKYVPGKAVALLVRADQVSGPGVVLGVSIVTAFYEVLTSMAAGALFAAVVFFIEPPQFRGLDFPPHLTGLLLLAGCGVPLLPGVFNFLARRLASKFPSLDVFHVPRLRLSLLLQGIALTSVGWGLMGLSVWCCLAGVMDNPQPPDWSPLMTWAYYTAIIGLAYVLGFAAFVLPGGAGIREWALREFLLFVGPAPVIAAGVLLLRLAWTLGEIVLAGVLWIVIPRKPASQVNAPQSPA